MCMQLHTCAILFLREEENQKLKEMIQSLGAGRTVDAQTFEDLGRKSGNPEHQTRAQKVYNISRRVIFLYGFMF